MAKGYLEQYLESVETLPSDLQRNFDLMKELDTQAESKQHARLSLDPDLYTWRAFERAP